MNSMQITWYGQSCIRLQGKGISLIFDPYNPSIGLKLPKIQSDILCVTHDHDDHNNVAAISGDPFVIQHAGEYEVKGVTIYGIDSFHDSSEGKERGMNVMYSVEMEDIVITHLGDLGTTTLTDAQLEKIEGSDVLCIPVGGVYTIDAKQAVDVIQKIEPRIVIPMHYAIPKLKYKLAAVDHFLKAIGAAAIKPEASIKLIKKELPQDETVIKVLQPIV